MDPTSSDLKKSLDLSSYLTPLLSLSFPPDKYRSSNLTANLSQCCSTWGKLLTQARSTSKAEAQILCLERYCKKHFKIATPRIIIFPSSFSLVLQ